jgi:hypothetical protein
MISELAKRTPMSDKHRVRENPHLPVTMICTYVPKAGKETELLALVKKHEPALRAAGLASDEPFRLWKAFDIRKQRTSYMEYFQWKDGTCSERAHQTPEVMSVWEPMGPVLEELVLCEVEAL